MLKAVTILGLAAATLVACADRRGADAPRCTVGVASAETLALEVETSAWRQRLPGVFKYDFERSADRAILAIPVCVKTADQFAERAKFVTTTGLWPTETIEVKYEYFFTPRRTRTMELKITREGDSWTGAQYEASFLGAVGLRGAELELPVCTAERLATPDEIRLVEKGRVSKVAALNDAPGALSCH